MDERFGWGGEGEEEGGLVEGLGDEGFGDGVILDCKISGPSLAYTDFERDGSGIHTVEEPSRQAGILDLLRECFTLFEHWRRGIRQVTFVDPNPQYYKSTSGLSIV